MKAGTWVALQVEMLLWWIGSRERIWDVGKESVHHKVPRNHFSLQNPRGLAVCGPQELSGQLCFGQWNHVHALGQAQPFFSWPCTHLVVCVIWAICGHHLGIRSLRSDLLWKSLCWNRYWLSEGINSPSAPPLLDGNKQLRSRKSVLWLPYQSEGCSCQNAQSQAW